MGAREFTTRFGSGHRPRGPGPPGRFEPPDGFAPRAGFTLIEVLIVIALLVVLAWFVVPVFTGELAHRRLQDSIGQLQTMIQLTRAHAMNDGKRYRIRWPDEDSYEDAEERGLTLQPIIEVEDDPIDEPGVFTEVKALWVVGETLHAGIQCTEVRLGRPKTAEEELEEELEREDRMDLVADGVEEMFEDDDGLDDMFEDDPDETGTEEEKDPIRPAIVFEPDGTAEWATILLTDGTENEEGEPQTWEILIDGRTGKVGWRRTLTEAQVEEAMAERQEQEEEHKIVRGREVGAR